MSEEKKYSVIKAESNDRLMDRELMGS